MCRAVWRCGLVMAILLALAPPVGAEDAQPDLATQTIPPAAAATILGHLVLDHAGEEVGPLVDLLVSRDGQPLAAVIDAGGFLGLGVRRIAVAWKLLRFTSAPDHIQITENLSLDELAAAPEYAGPDGSVIVVGRRPGQP